MGEYITLNILFFAIIKMIYNSKNYFKEVSLHCQRV